MTDQAYGPPAGIYGPVADWATDLDHADPAYNPQAPEIWAELRERGCPVVHSDRYGGMWAPLTHELVSEVAYDTENFTSRAVVVSTVKRDELAPAPIGGGAADHERSAVPPPRPAAPAPAVRAQEDRAVGAGDPQAVPPAPRRHGRRSSTARPSSTPRVQYAQHIPVNVIARMLGFPIEDDDLFREFVHDTLENVNRSPEERSAGFDRLDAYIDVQIEAHQATSTARRPHVVPARRRARGAEAVASTTSAARSSCSCSPASTRRGARSARACGTSPATPPTGAGWSTSPS